jgi:hypothetical protein
MAKQQNLLYSRLQDKLYVVSCAEQLTRLSYVNDALSTGVLPTFDLPVASQQPKTAAAAEAMAAELPEQAYETLPFDTLIQMLGNIKDEEKDKTRRAQEKEREQVEREQREKEQREREEQRLKDRAEKAAKAAAEAAAIEQERGSISVEFRLENGDSIMLDCSMSLTFEAIKQLLWTQLASKGSFSSATHFLKITGASYFVQDEEDKVPLFKYSFINFCKGKNMTPSFSILPKTVQQKEKLVSMKIGAIIGRPCHWRVEDNDSSDCRIKMYRIFGDKPTNWKTAVPVEISNDTLWPPNLSTTFQIKVHIPGDDVSSKTLMCNADQTSTELMAGRRKKEPKISPTSSFFLSSL